MNSAKMTLIGNVGRDAEARYAQDGKMILSFPVAFNEVKKDKDTGEEIKISEWVEVVAFDKQATFFKDRIKKGDKVRVEGRMSFDRWEKDGMPQKRVKILLGELQFVTWKDEAPQSSGSHPTNAKEPKADLTSPWQTRVNSSDNSSNLEEDLNDEIPF